MGSSGAGPSSHVLAVGREGGRAPGRRKTLPVGIPLAFPSSSCQSLARPRLCEKLGRGTRSCKGPCFEQTSWTLRIWSTRPCRLTWRQPLPGLGLDWKQHRSMRRLQTKYVYMYSIIIRQNSLCNPKKVYFLKNDQRLFSLRLKVGDMNYYSQYLKNSCTPFKYQTTGPHFLLILFDFWSSL